MIDTYESSGWEGSNLELNLDGKAPECMSVVFSRFSYMLRQVSRDLSDRLSNVHLDSRLSGVNNFKRQL